VNISRPDLFNKIMAKFLVTGATGFVGSRLVNILLAKGHQVNAFTRGDLPQRLPKGLEYFKWDPAKSDYNPFAFEGINHIINLAGAGIADKRWSEARKQEIALSRQQAAQVLIKGIENTEPPLKKWINASAIGWYGADTPESLAKGGFVETDPYATGFLGETCRDWEASVQPLNHLNIPWAIARIGLVCGPEAGVLKEFMKPLKMGIAPIMGSGKQIMSWIDADDLCLLLLWMAETPQITGIYNAVAPNPVSQKEFIKILASRQRFKIPIPVPAFVLKMMLGEMSIEVLKSTKVSSAKIEKAGFRFRRPTLQDMLSYL
jgi:uncharacterized protein